MPNFVIHPVTGLPVKLTEAGATTAATPAAREVKVGAADVTTTPQGRITVAFSTLNVIDSDGDVTLPGAFPPSEVVVSQWGHAVWDKGFLPIGRGTIREEGNRGIFRGELFIRASRIAAETFETLKLLGPLSEWSFGYNVALADRGMFEGRAVRFLKRLLVHEVSPVLKGAGVGTGVVEMSSVDRAQLVVAAAALHNERELAKLAGYRREDRTLIGYHPTTGAPIFASVSGGRGRKG